MTRKLAALALLLASACGRAPASPPADRPSILLVTLDTTRFDSIGPIAMSKGLDTNAFSALTARGRYFTQAYAAIPETLPSHTSIMTGLYPGGHGVHENARYVSAQSPVLAEQLQRAGYHTAAFVSAFVLDHRFGLARGFDRYDDEMPAGRNERNARETTDAAIRELSVPSTKPRFLWVHYYDAHAPYDPPEPYRSNFAKNPYLGEIRFVDEELSRLLPAFSSNTSEPRAIIVVADHGEGLGEHGEAQHGSLLYQGTMHVPLVVIGPGVPVEKVDTPVSTRRVYHTILDFAGLDAAHSLRGARREARGGAQSDAEDSEVVLGEAMKPFLEYGWQPQVMAVGGRFKAILSGRVETYDLSADSVEAHDLGSGAALPPGVRKALEDYPVPSPSTASARELDDDAKRRLASLGYVSSGAAPVVRKDAPRPADMTAMMDVIERASGLFADGRYKECLPLFERVLAADPHNIDAALRLASAHSALGENAKAIQMFQRAAEIAPDSQDVRTYLGLHYVRTKDWDRAATLLDQVVKESPDRATAVEALAIVKAKQGEMSMDAGETDQAIAEFERARALQPSTFTHDLDLGVLYIAAHRFEDSRAALDRFLAAHADDPMALFKRAQVSALLNEPDKNARIDLARRKADQTTRALIERERLFR